MTDDDTTSSRRFGRDSTEFGRVANLSDAIFGIAMTLLVFTLNDGDVSLDSVGSAITDQRGQLIAFVVSFALIANFWWIHHQLFAKLSELEPGLIVMNILLLGAVALVPYPTALLGEDPTTAASVVPYLGLINLISLIHLAMLVRATASDTWRVPVTPAISRWLIAVWGSSIVVTLAGFALAFVAPVAGLVVALLSWPVATVVERRAPAAYTAWA